MVTNERHKCVVEGMSDVLIPSDGVIVKVRLGYKVKIFGRGSKKYCSRSQYMPASMACWGRGILVQCRGACFARCPV